MNEKDEISEEYKKIPDNIISEGKEFVAETFRRRNEPVIKTSSYGHAVVSLASALRNEAENGRSPEKQKAFFKEAARKDIKKFGPKIITFMKDELKLALSKEDLAELGVVD